MSRTLHRHRMHRRAVVAFLLLILPGACASNLLESSFQNDQKGREVAIGESLTGKYLAGRHALVVREMDKAATYLGAALDMAPEEISLINQTFTLYISEGRFDQAALLAPKILADDPGAPIPTLFTVVEAFHKGDFQAALQAIDTLPNGGMKSYMSPLLQAWAVYGQENQTDKAIKKLEPLQKAGLKALFHLHSAIVLDVAGSTELAAKSYREAIRQQGGMTMRTAQLLGNLYTRSGQMAKAADVYKEHGITSPNSPLPDWAARQIEEGKPQKAEITTPADGAAEAFLNVATSFNQQNARDMALAFSRMGLRLKPDFPVMHMLLGNILQAQDRLESANKAYDAIEASSPYSWPTRLRSAENLNDLGQTDEAERILLAMAAERQDIPDPLIRLGDIFRGHERFSDAAEIYQDAFQRINKVEPHHWTLLYAHGIVLERSKQWPKAEEKFLSALELSPDQPYVLNYLGYSWIDQGINLDKGMEMIKRAVELRPTDGYIIDSLGWVHYRLGEYDDAVKQLERAIVRRPEDAIINDHLGDAFWRVGRLTEAKFQWRHALTLKIDDDKLRKTIEDKLVNGLTEAD